MKHDTLVGALIVTGRGDPSISDHMRGNAMTPLYDIADSLKAHGIKGITDGIRAGPDVFPDTTIGFGWSWDDLLDDDGAGVNALYFNEGFGTLVARGKPGMRPDSIQTLPARRYPTVLFTPGAANAHTDTGELRLGFTQFRNAFFLSGRIKTGQDTLIYVYPSFRRVSQCAHGCARRARDRHGARPSGARATRTPYRGRAVGLRAAGYGRHLSQPGADGARAGRFLGRRRRRPAALAAALDIHFRFEGGREPRARRRPRPVTAEIPTPEISDGASRVSALPPVRAALLDSDSAAWGLQGGVVVEGRDVGTVVFPEVGAKFFLTAMAKERAHRRAEELRAGGRIVDEDAVLKDIVMPRDERDSHRAVAPLRRPTTPCRSTRPR